MFFILTVELLEKGSIHNTHNQLEQIFKEIGSFYFVVSQTKFARPVFYF